MNNKGAIEAELKVEKLHSLPGASGGHYAKEQLDKYGILSWHKNGMRDTGVSYLS